MEETSSSASRIQSGQQDTETTATMMIVMNMMNGFICSPANADAPARQGRSHPEPYAALVKLVNLAIRCKRHARTCTSLTAASSADSQHL
jgi:hypothetical protein